MNRTFLSVFFSVLLGSTLGHEYHQKAHELSQRRNHDSRHNVASFRAGGLDTCSYSCPNPKPWDTNKNTYVHFISVPEAKAFGFLNEELNVAVIFDISSVLMINGDTGSTIFIEFESEFGIFFDTGSNDKLWNASKILVIDYIKNLGSLASIKKLENGMTFKIQAASKVIRVASLRIVRGVSGLIAKRGDLNDKIVLQSVVAIGKNLVGSKEVVRLLLGTMKTEAIVISRSLVRTANIFISLQLLNKKLPNGLHSLITPDFNLSLLMSAPSGFEAIIYLLRQAGEKLDLAKVLGDDIIKSPIGILQIIYDTDAGSYGGISGLTALIYIVMKYNLKQISLEDLIDVLIQIEAANSVKIKEERWKIILKSKLYIIDNQIKTYNTGQAWEKARKSVQDTLDDKLVDGKINISAMLKVLISTSGEVHLNNLLKILLQLKVVVSPTTIVSTLLLRIIWFLLSGQGLLYVTELFPDLTITIDFASTTSIIKQILGGLDLSKLMRYIVTLNVIELILHLPVIGPIVESLDVGLKVVGFGTLATISAALKASGSIVSTLKNWLWHGLGLSGGKEPSGGSIAGQGIIGGGVSINWSGQWTIVSKASGVVSSSGGAGGSGSGGSSGSGSGSGSNSDKGSSSQEGSYGSSSHWPWGIGRRPGSSSGGGGSYGGSSGWHWSWGGGSSSGSSHTSGEGSSKGSSAGGSSGSGGSKGHSGWSWSWGSSG